ncbi:hypothetical protein PG985_005513 [Apiospora marii]|uniref:uncharacterized protein n=1 Tax=Apiospora marii TaxID=335849 RepID=UPI00312DD68C
MSAPDDVGSVEPVQDLIIVNTQSTQSSQSNDIDSRPTSLWPTQPVELIELAATTERADSLEPVMQSSSLLQQRNRKQSSTRRGRAAALPRFKSTSEIRGMFMERVLDAKRDSMLTIARAGEMKKAFEYIAVRMKAVSQLASHWTWQKARARYIEYRKRWQQWLQAERSGTGPDALGFMRAPPEVFDRLFEKDPSARWIRSEPLVNISAYEEVFGRTSATGMYIREAGATPYSLDSHTDDMEDVVTESLGEDDGDGVSGTNPFGEGPSGTGLVGEDSSQSTAPAPSVSSVPSLPPSKRRKGKSAATNTPSAVSDQGLERAALTLNSRQV